MWKMKRKRNKLFSLLLAAALVLGTSGVMAFATEADDEFNESIDIQGDTADDDSYIEPSGDDILTETEYGSELGSSELTEGSVADNTETEEGAAEDITEYDADFDENAAEDIAEDLVEYGAAHAVEEEVDETSEDIEDEDTDIEDADDEEDMDEDYGISVLASKSTSTSNTYMAYPSTSGRLQVIGTQLCDQNGNPVQLKGVSSHGLSWYPEYVNSSCLADLRSWGANVFRLAMYTADYNGYCTGGNQTTLKNLIKQGVDAAKANDMYVIIDWHILSDSNPLTYQSQAKSFFEEMAKEFSGYNNVIYEICNEPNSGTSWSDIKSYANTIIPAIRKYDSNAVIIVGTPTWSQDVDVAAADPLTGYNNIMYSLHFYAATHKDDLRNKMTSAINAGLPVFVSEYGICDSSGSGSIDESSANTWVSLMNQYGVSYVMWNMSNKDESSAILKSSVTKTSGFSYDDLSQSGRWLLSMLGGSVAGTSGSGTDIVKINGVWTYTENGKANYSYTGLAKNSNGWYYIKNGVLDRSYTGFATNSNGKWYVESGKVTKKTNGVFKDKTGAIGSSSEWYYVLNSKVQTSFTGLADYSNASGWWYITKGKVDRSYNGLAKNKNGWFYLTNGKVDRSYTGFAQNSNGKWYVTKGKLTRKDNTVLKDKTGAIGSKNAWYYVVGSKVQTSFTGLANYSNSSGWWYITNGKVDRSYNGLAKNKNGWFYLTNGKVNRSYTGLTTNSNGTWYVKNGKVQKSFTGTVTIGGKQYSVTKGKV